VPELAESARVVVISAGVGAGHDGAAGELARRLRERGAQVAVHDYLDALPVLGRRLLRDGYQPTVQRAPRLFAWLFRKLEHRGPVQAVAQWLCRRAAPRVRHWSEHADVVVSTYRVASETVGRLRAARRWWPHRHAYPGLERLWRLMSQAFPEEVLHRVPTSRWRRFITFQSMHRRYYRRVIECRDGLVRISPYLPRAEAAGAELTTAVVRAHRLRAALRARAHQFPPTGGPRAFASPRSPDLDADVAELLALSRALNPPTTTLSDRPGARPRTRE